MAVFVVALINLTLQPCAMAAQALVIAADAAVSEHCLEHGHQVPQQEHKPVDNCGQDADFLTDVRPAGDSKKSEDSAKLIIPCDHYGPRGSCVPPPAAGYFDLSANYPGSPSIPDLLRRYLK